MLNAPPPQDPDLLRSPTGGPKPSSTAAGTPALRAAPYALLALFCLSSLAVRPLLPPDETRYLTVAWEMMVSHQWFVPTLNFAPYHHKPPLLFWLIDLIWTFAGIGRAQAMLAVFGISAAVLALTRRLGEALWPDRADISERLPWLMLGNVVFVLYSSLVLFDLLLTACVIAAFLAGLAFARGRGMRWAVVAGLFVGLGVLAKGPAVLIHIIWPFALYPLWRTAREPVSGRRLAAGAGVALLAALLPVAVWLVPALLQTDGRFAHDLLWEQSAGRITGHMEASHPRPFYYYLLLLPFLGMPWLLSPDVWRTRPVRRLRDALAVADADGRSLRLLLLWSAGIFVTFSLISGKQPHYLMPMLPLATAILARLTVSVPLLRIRLGAVACLAIMAGAQAALAPRFLSPFDLTPVTDILKPHPRAPVGFVGGYQGELGFLSRRLAPVETVDKAQGAAWLAAHPGGYLVVEGRNQVEGLPPELLRIPYRSRTIALYGPPALPAP